MQCRPKVRAKRSPVKRFKLVTPLKDGSNSKQSDEQNQELDVEVGGPCPTRWTIEPRGVQKLLVKFSSEDAGRFQENLLFEISCPGSPTRPATGCVRVTGVCDYPRISDDFRDVFYRKVRSRPRSPLISRQYIIPAERFEFGPLLSGKSKTEDLSDQLTAENYARLRILNNGLFDVHVEFRLNATEEPITPAKGHKAPVNVSPFSLDPCEMNLSVGESRDLVVCAFPMEVGESTDCITCSVDGNPSEATFAISCVGAKPLAEVRNEESEDGVRTSR